MENPSAISQLLTGNCRLPLLIVKVLRQVGMFVFLTNLSNAHAFRIGSLLISSYITVSNKREPLLRCKRLLKAHRNRHQQARPLHLTHVRDPRLMRLELPDHLPALANDADVSIARAEKQAVGACADAGNLVALEELAGFIVRQRYLRDVEEVERLPLWARVLAVGRTFASHSSPSAEKNRCWKSKPMPVLAHVLRWPSCRLGEAEVGRVAVALQRTMTMAGQRAGCWSCAEALNARCTQLG